MNQGKNKFLNYSFEVFNLKNLISEHTCFKSQNPTMIDLILTNNRSSFMKSAVLETGISGHHDIIFSILKHTFAKDQPKLFSIKNWKILIKKR